MEKIHHSRRVNWAKASEEAKEKYTKTLANKLNSVLEPDCVKCLDLHCQVHTEELEDYTMSVLEAVESAAKECLPSSGGGGGECSSKRQHLIPGWSEHVKPFCEESKFWGAVWESAGKPADGDLHDLMMKSKCQYKYAVRRLKRANHHLQGDKFVQGLLSGGVDIFSEIKKFRGKVKNCSSRIDDQVGSQNIANHFAEIYSQLYSRHQHDSRFEEMADSINKAVNDHSITEVERITPALVRKALKQMKNGKSDAIFDFQSDCLTSGPDEVVTHLTNLLKCFVSHGRVPYFILVCTLLPLVKDNLADITSSENYRAIASGSLVLKLLDIVVLLLEGDKLECDHLQFGFQAKSSTSMCSWTATAVIEHYNRNGKAVYACAMDLSKAFDLVEWVELFTILKQKNMSPVFLRVLLFIYRNQYCDVKWNSSYSYRFPVQNGVRQGAVSSPLLFSVYIDGLIKDLRASGLGCRMDRFFLGCLGYADDLLLLSASRSGLQGMVDICQKFAKSKRLKFSTHVDPAKSKTKCILFAKKLEAVSPIFLNGDPLPWVKEVKHLGNILQCNNTMKMDCVRKRGKFIGKVNSLLQEFHFVQPKIFVQLLSIYASSFYGSNLWNLYSHEVDRIYKSWNVTIRNVYNLPWTTHRYFIEDVSGCLHPKTTLSSRYIKFVASLTTSAKTSVRYLASLAQHDKRTLLGRTLWNISSECGVDLDGLTPQVVKKSLRYFPVPEQQQWRVGLLFELLEARSNTKKIANLTRVEVENIIEDICTT